MIYKVKMIYPRYYIINADGLVIQMRIHWKGKSQEYEICYSPGSSKNQWSEFVDEKTFLKVPSDCCMELIL